MFSELVDTVPEYSFPWLAEHIAAIDEQIQLCESVAKDGTATVTVDLPNYLSLHRYTRELILLLDEVKRHANASEQRARLLELRTYRRPRGRPRTLKSIAKGTGLLAAAFATESKPQSRKGGRPRTNSPDDLSEYNAIVTEYWREKHGDDSRLNVKRGLRELLSSWAEEYAKKRAISPTEIAGAVANAHESLYKPLMKYRAEQGQRLNRKSQNWGKKTPDFSGLEATFGRWQSVPYGGIHQAARRHKGEPQTGKARRQRK